MYGAGPASDARPAQPGKTEQFEKNGSGHARENYVRSEQIAARMTLFVILFIQPSTV